MFQFKLFEIDLDIELLKFQKQNTCTSDTNFQILMFPKAIRELL